MALAGDIRRAAAPAMLASLVLIFANGSALSSDGKDTEEGASTSTVILGPPETIPPMPPDGARRDLLVGLLAAHGCRLPDFQVRPKLLGVLTENGFLQDELRQIGDDLILRGWAVRYGDVLILTDAACS